jgi:hypothetical protein
MAGGQYTTLRGGARCSFGIAMQFLALRNLAAAQAAPDVFALDNWPNELLRLFWALWGALERGLIHTYSYDKEIPASDWIRDRFKLEEQLRHREVLGLFPFIGAAAQLTKHSSVDADELLTAFLPPSVETPPVEPPAVARSKQPQKSVAPEDGAERDVSLERMIRDAYETGGARNKTEAREQVCERAEAMGLRVTQKRFDAAFSNAGVRGPSGPRREISPPRKLP